MIKDWGGIDTVMTVIALKVLVLEMKRSLHRSHILSEC